MWGIFRFTSTIDTLGVIHTGEWCADPKDPWDGILLFDTRAEAERLAGVWNATSTQWSYVAKKFP